MNDTKRSAWARIQTYFKRKKIGRHIAKNLTEEECDRLDEIVDEIEEAEQRHADVEPDRTTARREAYAQRREAQEHFVKSGEGDMTVYTFDGTKEEFDNLPLAVRNDFDCDDDEDVFELLPLPEVRAEMQNGREKTPLIHRGVECILRIDEDTPLLLEEGADCTHVLIRRPPKHVQTQDQKAPYPLEAVCLTNACYAPYLTQEPHEDGDDMERKVSAMTRLTSKQKAFLADMGRRPKQAELATSKKEESFLPISDVRMLRMMYNACRDTYSPQVRARADILFEKIDHDRFGSGQKEHILKQIAYTIGIDTTPKPHQHRTYEEVIAILDKHIYGMEKLKKAFAEFILSMQYSGASYCAILLVGPPGVGKTSICNAMVECLDVPLLHVDCSGADPISMTGLVSSYNGAKASKVVDAFYDVGRTDALVLLDEIDKMTPTKQGDPYSALIKPLGPQRVYYDEYVNGDIDVSATKFVATANYIDQIPGYILNRFGGNVFVIDPYTAEEKAQIARNYVLPKQLAHYRVLAEDLVFEEEAFLTIAREYCFDEGAREITGHIVNLIRKVITEWERGIAPKPLHIDSAYVRAHLEKKDVTATRKIGFVA